MPYLIGFYAGDENLYAYVGNNSINLTDPTGLCSNLTLGGGGSLSYNTGAHLINNVNPGNPYDWDNASYGNTVINYGQGIYPGPAPRHATMADLAYVNAPLTTNGLNIGNNSSVGMGSINAITWANPIDIASLNVSTVHSGIQSAISSTSAPSTHISTNSSVSNVMQDTPPSLADSGYYNTPAQDLAFVNPASYDIAKAKYERLAQISAPTYTGSIPLGNTGDSAFYDADGQTWYKNRQVSSIEQIGDGKGPLDDWAASMPWWNPYAKLAGQIGSALLPGSEPSYRINFKYQDDFGNKSLVVLSGGPSTGKLADQALTTTGIYQGVTALRTLAKVPRTTVVNNGSAPMTGYTWNQVLQARYGAENVTWVQPKLPSEPLTLGMFRTPTGDFELASGWNGYAPMMPKGSPGFDIITRTHVEGQAAALMRRQGIGEGVLYINNSIICPNCTRNLPYMLGPGKSLQVVLPNSSPVPFTGLRR